MTYIITPQELEHLSETELRRKYSAILADLASRNLSAADCPLAMVTLENILRAIQRKRAHKQLGPLLN